MDIVTLSSAFVNMNFLSPKQGDLIDMIVCTSIVYMTQGTATTYLAIEKQSTKQLFYEIKNGLISHLEWKNHNNIYKAYFKTVVCTCTRLYTEINTPSVLNSLF